MIQHFVLFHENIQKGFRDAPTTLMTFAFIGVAVVALYFAFFNRNPIARAIALAYFVLP
jgi:hypothetical protein